MLSMVDVALVNPATYAYSTVHPPLNLAFIASYLEKNGVSVKIIDEVAGQKAEKELERSDPKIVGITALTASVLKAYRIADFAKENLDALVVMGGVHASAMSDEALQHVDVVVKGEGERAMLDIVKNGVNSRIVSRQFIKNIDEIPIPARHLMNMYFYLGQTQKIGGKEVKKVGSLITSRGCPYRCIFCYNSWRDTPVRFHSAKRVVEELEHLRETYDVKYFTFSDDSFTAYKKRLETICELMIEKKLSEIPWDCPTRADLVNLEMLKMMRKAGCMQIFFGFESGSQRILDILKKGTTVRQNEEAIKLCKQAGIRVHGSFMIGNPTETLEDIKATERFIKKNDIDSADVSIAIPFPGTKFWKWACEHNLAPQEKDYPRLTLGISFLASDTIPRNVLKAIYTKLRIECIIKSHGKLWIKGINPSAVFKNLLKLVRS
jgi:anaerobic magnesium-protoporphyrin IX monomethyl ester cyclase